MENSEIFYVAVKPENNPQPILGVFSECARQAQTIEEFRSLIETTVAHKTPYQILPAGQFGYSKILEGWHLFKVDRSSGNPRP